MEDFDSYSYDEIETKEEKERRLRRQEKIRQMHLEKKRAMRRRELLKKLAPFALFLLIVLILCIVLIVKGVKKHHANSQTEGVGEGTLVYENVGEVSSADSDMEGLPADIEGLPSDSEKMEAVEESSNSENIDSKGQGTLLRTSEFGTQYSAIADSSTRELPADDENMQSNYAVLIDMDSSKIVAQKYQNTRISPASMTKILTLLVAVEHLTQEDLEDRVTITIEDTDFAYSNDCSAVGFAVDEVVTVKDLLYGTILPSGGDAAYALSKYVSGSQEEFVKLMNERLEELGLAGSAHFTNCVGLYDDNHYCSVYDMAVIMMAAYDNPTCREVLSAHKYTTSKSSEHPEGIEISNWFLRRIEDKDTNGEVLCAKTGFVVQSRNCGASVMKSNSGTTYVCVTADAHSSWRCIYDHVTIYQRYT